MMKTLHAWSILGVALLSGCGSSVSVPPMRAAGMITGTVALGPVAGATVTAYAGDGSAVLGVAQTDSGGHYAVTLSAPSQTVLLAATGGHYREEASGAGVQLGASDVLYAYTPYVSGQTAVAAITPFTHLAVALARYLESQGTPLATAAIEANAALDRQLGFDAVATQPLDVADPMNADTQLTPGLTYGFLLAAISQWTQQAQPLAEPAGVTAAPFDSIDWSQQVYQDMRLDGTLNGQGTDGAAHLASTPLTGISDCHGLAVALVQLAATPGGGSSGSGTGNETGLPVQMLLPEAATYNANLAGLCAGAQPPLTEGGLQIQPDPVTPPESSGWVRGQTTFTGEVQDAFGIRGNTVEISVDGSAPVAAPVTEEAPGLYQYRWPLDTTAYGPDARHNLVVTATDLGGYTGLAAVALGFDNTPPTGCVSVYAPMSAGTVFAGEWRDGTGSGVVAVALNDVPGTVGPGVWQVPEAPVLATVPGLNLLYNVLPVYLSLTDAAGNTTRFDIFPEPQWSEAQNPVSCYVF